MTLSKGNSKTCKLGRWKIFIRKSGSQEGQSQWHIMWMNLSTNWQYKAIISHAGLK